MLGGELAQPVGRKQGRRARPPRWAPRRSRRRSRHRGCSPPGVHRRLRAATNTLPDQSSLTPASRATHPSRPARRSGPRGGFPGDRSYFIHQACPLESDVLAPSDSAVPGRSQRARRPSARPVWRAGRRPFGGRRSPRCGQHLKSTEQLRDLGARGDAEIASGSSASRIVGSLVNAGTIANRCN